MFQAKTFYALTGLKRSTVRFYQGMGLLTPEVVGENGYAYYSDRALVMAMLIRSYRSVDLAAKDMVDPEKFRMEAQIDHLEELMAGYRDEIALLERKIRMLKVHQGVIKRYRTLGEVMEESTHGLDLRRFFVRQAMKEAPEAAEEEIARCISSFPFVHITARGRLEDLETKGAVEMEPGYAYRADRGLYTPAHPGLYAPPPPPCTRLQLRLKVRDPMALTAEDLAPLLAELDRRSLPHRGQFYTTIPGVEERDGHWFYFTCIWFTLKEEN